MKEQINHLKKQVEINDKSQGTYKTRNQIKFETSMIKSNLCHYRVVYIDVKATITIPNTGTAAAPNNVHKKNNIKKLCSIY